MKIIWSLVVILSVCGVPVKEISAARLQEKYVWKQLTFAWPSYAEEQSAISSGRYVRENNMPLGMELWGDKVFITVPRWFNGTAASLAYIHLPTDERSPILYPYPNWESHDLEKNFPRTEPKKNTANGDCSIANNYLDRESRQSTGLSTAMVSPFRIKADRCDRLWTLDSGLDGIILPEKREVTPPTVIVFDLIRDTVISRYEFPDNFVVPTSSFPNLLVDVAENHCEDAFLYITDVTGYALIVYSLKENRAWRVTHNFFYFDPLEGNLLTGGVNYQVPDGIFGLAIGNHKQDGSRDVFFHALSSTKEYVVSNKVLQNETRALSRESFYDYYYLGDRGANGQSTAQIFDPHSEIIFYSQINKDAVGCWNSQKPYTPDNQGLVDADSIRLNFVNSFFIDKADNLWVLSNKLANIIFGKGVNATDDNYRILGGRISELIIGTPCDFISDKFYLQYPDYQYK